MGLPSGQNFTIYPQFIFGFIDQELQWVSGIVEIYLKCST